MYHVPGPPYCIPLRGNPHQTNKVAAYWQLAGLPDVLYDGNQPVAHPLALQPQIPSLRPTEITAANQHLDRLASLIRQSETA